MPNVELARTEEGILATCCAPGCTRPTAEADGKAKRTIAGREVCQACYARFWRIAEKRGVTISEAFTVNPPPLRTELRLVDTVCSRAGCGKHLPKLPKNDKRTFICGVYLCRTCNDDLVRLAREMRTLKEKAFPHLPPCTTWRKEKRRDDTPPDPTPA